MQISGQCAYRALGLSPVCIPEGSGKVSVFVIWGQRHRDARESFEQGGSARGLSYSRPFRKAIAPRVSGYCEATRVLPGKTVQLIRWSLSVLFL
jgi:hypothetical protein